MRDLIETKICCFRRVTNCSYKLLSFLKLIIIKGTQPWYFTTTWGRHVRLYDHNQIGQGCWSAGRYHPCQIWKQTIRNCYFGKRLNFTILALLGPSPFTRLSPAGLSVISMSILDVKNPDKRKTLQLETWTFQFETRYSTQSDTHPVQRKLLHHTVQ